MANVESNYNSNKTRKKGFIRSLIATLFFSLFISIVIECIGIMFLGIDDNHSSEMLNTEFGYLAKDFVDSIILSEPLAFAECIITNVYQFLVIKTGLLDIVSGNVDYESSVIYKFINSL